MERSKYLIFIFACILLIGCIPQHSTNNSGNESKDINPTQKAFYELATKYYEREDSLTNIVAKDELFNEYQSSLVQFFDTAVVYNWIYTIMHLDIHDNIMNDTVYKEIEFSLLSHIGTEKPQIEFKAVYFVKSDSINSDSTYIQLKSISNYDKVKFSGIVFKRNGSYLLDSYKSIKERLSDPKFEIGIVELKKVD